MKTLLTCILIVLMVPVFAQLKQKTVEKSDGSYTYTYHSNGKESTVQFWPLEIAYGTQGYARAYDKTGKLIYEAVSSRSAMICGTHFSYYENGAIKTAEYSAHPDAGIQWHRKTTYFDENGVKTGEFEQNHDDRVTILSVPDSVYRNEKNDQKNAEEFRRQQKLKAEREQFIKDSTTFYYSDTTTTQDGVLVIVKPDPANEKRETRSYTNGKMTKSLTEFFQQKEGVISITRTYYKNGRIHEEWMVEPQATHYRVFDKKGRLSEEKLNQKVTP